jgi:hypothetical protein
LNVYGFAGNDLIVNMDRHGLIGYDRLDPWVPPSGSIDPITTTLAPITTKPNSEGGLPSIPSIEDVLSVENVMSLVSTAEYMAQAVEARKSDTTCHQELCPTPGFGGKKFSRLGATWQFEWRKYQKGFKGDHVPCEVINLKTGLKEQGLIYTRSKSVCKAPSWFWSLRGAYGAWTRIEEQRKCAKGPEKPPIDNVIHTIFDREHFKVDAVTH